MSRAIRVGMVVITGYSLLNMYPVADFQSVVFSTIRPIDSTYTEAMKNPFLLYKVPGQFLQGVNAVHGCTTASIGGGVVVKPDWSACRLNSGGVSLGRVCILLVVLSQCALRAVLFQSTPNLSFLKKNQRETVL